MSLPVGALAAALFVYLTAELFPIGVQDVIADDLGTTEARVGLLLTAYAVVVGLTTLPVVHVAQHVSHGGRWWWVHGAARRGTDRQRPGSRPGDPHRHRCLAAIAHGLVWSQAPVLAVRLARPDGAAARRPSCSPGRPSRLLLGSPLVSVAGALVGWRATAVGIGAARGDRRGGTHTAASSRRSTPVRQRCLPRCVGRPVALVGLVTAISWWATTSATATSDPCSERVPTPSPRGWPCSGCPDWSR